jgi:hypothetical protein
LTATNTACQGRGDAKLTDASLSTAHLSTFGLRREPPRPVADRQAGYETLFDFDTLFYDTGWKIVRWRPRRWAWIAYGPDRPLARAFAVAFPDRVPPLAGFGEPDVPDKRGGKQEPQGRDAEGDGIGEGTGGGLRKP